MILPATTLEETFSKGDSKVGNGVTGRQAGSIDGGRKVSLYQWRAFSTLSQNEEALFHRSLLNNVSLRHRVNDYLYSSRPCLLIRLILAELYPAASAALGSHLGMPLQSANTASPMCLDRND